MHFGEEGKGGGEGLVGLGFGFGFRFIWAHPPRAQKSDYTLSRQKIIIPPDIGDFQGMKTTLWQACASPGDTAVPAQT